VYASRKGGKTVDLSVRSERGASMKSRQGEIPFLYTKELEERRGKKAIEAEGSRKNPALRGTEFLRCLIRLSANGVKSYRGPFEHGTRIKARNQSGVRKERSLTNNLGSGDGARAKMRRGGAWGGHDRKGV